ncbi:MAG: hypothetical protein M1824_002400 [Vezdaea acicularis]|nr:MAG: hypothetical protein M1824_002400 [Vezdaea acicularis]
MSSVRVVARIRPLLRTELRKDVIIEAAQNSRDSLGNPTIVRIPNPKNAGEEFSFQFNSVYDQEATQDAIFQAEITPTIKHLFQGFDVTLFAYGVTGTGKTWTMKGGKSLAERGVIPRLLSGVYRRGRKLEKDSQGETTVEVSLSYYEIYNDRVFDLFEAPEKRTATGLPLREAGGKTHVVGLVERACTTLKEFEQLYDEANLNRSTSATKLNAHSSRSHAILCVKLSITTGDEVKISTASAIDLAGSEDNRRTENGKERLVESASINKSLFVLSQCVEAISKKQNRIPYRESKMTRILGLGQNQGITVMILNLAPVRSYHLDTLSSLNFANRTKKIETKEIENEPIFKGPAKAIASITGSSIQRQPLRPLASNTSLTRRNSPASKKGTERPTKEFSVFSDRPYTSNQFSMASQAKRDSSAVKRPLETLTTTRPAKLLRPSGHLRPVRNDAPSLTKATVEELVERKVEAILAARALDGPAKAPERISEEVQRRLDQLEQRIEDKEDGRSEGLNYLLMAKQHLVRGEDASALRMYQLATSFFPDNEKLAHKVAALQEKLRARKREEEPPMPVLHEKVMNGQRRSRARADDSNYESQEQSASSEYEEEETVRSRPKPHKVAKLQRPFSADAPAGEQTPRTQHLLQIINSRDISRIKLLRGIGAKKAETIIESLGLVDEDDLIEDLAQLGRLKGVGAKTVQNMRSSLVH